MHLTTFTTLLTLLYLRQNLIYLEFLIIPKVGQVSKRKEIKNPEVLDSQGGWLAPKALLPLLESLFKLWNLLFKEHEENHTKLN